MELADLTIARAAQLLRERAISPVELTRACLSRIDELNPKLNAFITIMRDSALDQARSAEREIQQGQWRGPLHGIPIALKDLIDTAGVRTTAASALFADRVPDEDAEVVHRLKRSGAILMGKTNLHEFAYGGSSVVSYFGPVRNARNPEHIAGGSSGGSAVAVASGMCLGAIGTDTAGSIRLPASFCGVVGLKPTYGLVSARGVIPLAWSYDHVGPITRTVEDAALMLAAIAGYDERDVFSRQLPLADYARAANEPLKRVRIGIGRNTFWDDLHPDVAVVVNRAINTISELASETREVTVPIEPDRHLANAESYAYHLRWITESPEKYQPSTLERLRTGEKVTAADCLFAQQRLERMRRKSRALFESVDVIVTPTVPVPPPASAELEADPANLRRREVIMLRNTRPWNVLGLPTISVPCGWTSRNLPVGLQITAAAGGEADLLRVAVGFERALNTAGVGRS
jgi:aspartyl-tRNA(Asn)/glutamyl-tRNA(Gln) amidotransferase subunit A